LSENLPFLAMTNISVFNDSARDTRLSAKPETTSSTATPSGTSKPWCSRRWTRSASTCAAAAEASAAIDNAIKRPSTAMARPATTIVPLVHHRERFAARASRRASSMTTSSSASSRGRLPACLLARLLAMARELLRSEAWFWILGSLSAIF